jgi:hypothetical protein
MVQLWRWVMVTSERIDVTMSDLAGRLPGHRAVDNAGAASASRPRQVGARCAAGPTRRQPAVRAQQHARTASQWMGSARLVPPSGRQRDAAALDRIAQSLRAAQCKRLPNQRRSPFPPLGAGGAKSLRVEEG